MLIRFVFSEPPFMVPLPFIHAGYKEEVKLAERTHQANAYRRPRRSDNSQITIDRHDIAENGPHVRGHGIDFKIIQRGVAIVVIKAVSYEATTREMSNRWVYALKRDADALDAEKSDAPRVSLMKDRPAACALSVAARCGRNQLRIASH